jgi:thiamine-monophosphate kinase
MAENSNTQITELSQLGEFGLIQKLTNDIIIKNTETVKGIGDDSAVLSYPDEQIVVTNDLLIEGIHFNLAYTPLKHLGYKAAIVNISDVLAMNAIPKQLIVSFAVSNRFGVEAMEDLYYGIKSACNLYQVDLVGGDTCSSQKGLFLSITAIGSARKENIVYRKGARKNDILCVTGNLGAAYIGLQLLERENKIFLSDPQIQPQLEGYDYILQRQLRPEARIDIVRFFRDYNIVPTSMIDISDGLSSETIHLCNNSGIGCNIFEDKIPIAGETAQTAGEFGIEPLMCALNGGEDYELLFSVAPFDYEKIRENSEITAIGHFTGDNDGLKLFMQNGTSIDLSPNGWNSFDGKK